MINSRRSRDKPTMCVKYDRRYDPDAWYVKPSPDECKPSWTFPINRPVIIYCSTAEIRKSSNLREIKAELMYDVPGRTYVQQGVCIYSFNKLNHFKRINKVSIMEIYNYYINFGYILYPKVDIPHNYKIYF